MRLAPRRALPSTRSPRSSRCGGPLLTNWLNCARRLEQGGRARGRAKNNNTYETSSALQGARRGGPENLNRPGQTQKLAREAASTKQMHHYTVYALTIG